MIYFLCDHLHLRMQTTQLSWACLFVEYIGDAAVAFFKFFVILFLFLFFAFFAAVIFVKAPKSELLCV